MTVYRNRTRIARFGRVRLFLTLMALLLLSACAGATDNRSPEAVAEAYIEACNAGEVSAATALIVPGLREMARTNDHCRMVTRALYTRDGEVRVRGETAYVPYRVTENRQNARYEVMLVQGEEGWRIQAIRYEGHARD